MATKKTVNQYYDENIAAGQPAHDEMIAKQKAISDENLAGIHQAIDESAAQASGVYQKRIDSSDAQYKTRYADNAVQEAFNRQQIKEAIANSGMTDSGYNRTMQTALTLNRSRQDAAVTADKQSYVQKLQDAIDSVMTQAAAEKKTQTMTANQNFANWQAEQDQEFRQSAWDNAVASVNADTEAEAMKYTADQNVVAAQIEAVGKQDTNRQNYAMKLIQNGYDPKKAWAMAYSQYPTGNDETDSYYSQFLIQSENGWDNDEMDAYVSAGGGAEGMSAADLKSMEKAKSVVGPIDLKVSGWDTWYKNQNGDGEEVANKISKALISTTAYKKLTKTQQQYALAEAVGKCVGQNWQGKGNETDNLTRIKVACDTLGVDYNDALYAYNQYYTSGTTNPSPGMDPNWSTGQKKVYAKSH